MIVAGYKSLILFLILAALFLVWVIPHLSGKYRVWQINNVYKNLSETHGEDTFGGKTAEETYDLFLQALKEEDIELASKYFVSGKQGDWLIIFKEYERNGLLARFTKELEEANKIRKESDKNTVTFEKYPTGIWKISAL